jgi:hypothetical protein
VILLLRMLHWLLRLIYVEGVALVVETAGLDKMLVEWLMLMLLWYGILRLLQWRLGAIEASKAGGGGDVVDVEAGIHADLAVEVMYVYVN